ncbi:MAG: methylenetetrahydrofolate reductase [Microbacteriaceae bacterium]
MLHEESRCPERTPFSFEIFPPRTPDAEQALPHTIQRLAAAGPDFISVTYGAGGSSRRSSLAVLRYILERTDVDPLAHLTCVGSSHVEANRLVREFLDAGITRFLALRGDPPGGAAEGGFSLGDLRSAAELVQLIHRVQEERAQYEIIPSQGSRLVGTLRPARAKVDVAVAAFPNGHPHDNARTDIEALLAKQTAGATFAITQLFFHAEDYLAFVARARQAGVDIPILPGIMPVTSITRLNRTVELSHEQMPVDLLRRLQAADSPARQATVGIDHAIDLARQVLSGGATGLHLYTFNQHQAVLSVLDGAELLGASTSEETR